MRVNPRLRPFLWISLLGVTCSLLVGLAGRVAEQVRLGSDREAAYARVEREVKSEFDLIALTLGRIAEAEARAAAPVLRRAADDRDLRPLFARAADLVSGAPSQQLALTVYDASGAPLAWAGRPSELAVMPRLSPPGPGRLAAPVPLFVAPGPLGFRLVRVEPVMAPATRSPVLLGAVAAEHIFSARTAPGASSERLSIETSLAPVVLKTRFEGAGDRLGPYSFIVTSPSGATLLEAQVDPDALDQARRDHRTVVSGLVATVLGLTLLLLVGPFLDQRQLARKTGPYVWATLASAGLVVAARLLFVLALPPGRIAVLSPDVYHWSRLGGLARHPADFLLSGLTLLALVALMAGPIERRRQMFRGTRRDALAGIGPTFIFVLVHAVGGALLALAAIGYERFLAETFRRATVDILRFSPHPWQTERMAIAFGLICFHAAFVWALVLALRLLLARWRFRRADFRMSGLLLLAWGLPIAAIWTLAWRGPLGDLPRVEALLVVGAVAAAACFGPRGLGRLRHASQGYRLIVGLLALLASAAVMYPSLVFFQEGAEHRIVESDFGPEVLDQRESLRMRLRAAQAEIDGREAALEAYVSAPAPPPGSPVRTDSAFLMWQGTALERYRVSSAIELYNSAEMLVSRFALNLPEEASGQPWHEEDCTWRTFGEVSPFGSHERQLLHAGRNICGPAGRLGTIVIHVILDYSTASFLSTQSPYLELLRGASAGRRDQIRGRDVNFVVYGWSRTPLYVSGDSAWPIDDALFARVYASRRPFWAHLSLSGIDYHVYFENDRSGIYALGYATISVMGHFINLAELTVLVGTGYVGLLLGAVLFRAAGVRRIRSGRALLREIRESFYRKLFLAFVAASVIPVVTLALVTRVYIADRLRSDVESAAHKTTVIARQIIEDYRVQTSATLSDDAMVGLSRAIGQDVNIFRGARLQATSERDLFASGLLPARTPADVYRAIVLDRMPTVFTQEQAAGFGYMLAAAPLRAADPDSVLTIPLTLRQREIEREIDDLDRRIVLAAMLFILVGAAVGYPMAERIADPVNRLMRATRRIARGDFDARVAATSSDELGRLVEAFNHMSAELLRYRKELERTHRLEAWAEMARQVAHDIKNPLTPIQLSAEHLRRVHADRGRPLGPVLDGCVDSILSQVRLLRQIASEFSSFASHPTARIGPTNLAELVEEVVHPYEVGSGERWHFVREFGAALRPVMVDRALMGRALTNIIDNALHAMPEGGTLTVAARQADQTSAELALIDTGVGMDEAALARLFEPYFSTKAVGTGLGLSIARRNVELNGGTIAVSSERGHGTRVVLTLPSQGPLAPAVEGRHVRGHTTDLGPESN
jgi:signal transduction histidine kinase